MSGEPALGRLDGAEWGLLIDRESPLTFTFDGRVHTGFKGDVVASALYAEGRALISRSFKYHRPRGVLTMAGHDANAFLQIADEPNVRADRQPITQGLAVQSINRLGSLDWDGLAALDKLGRFLPVGFYYKTFFRPRGAWPLSSARSGRSPASAGSMRTRATGTPTRPTFLPTSWWWGRGRRGSARRSRPPRPARRPCSSTNGPSLAGRCSTAAAQRGARNLWRYATISCAMPAGRGACASSRARP